MPEESVIRFAAAEAHLRQSRPFLAEPRDGSFWTALETTVTNYYGEAAHIGTVPGRTYRDPMTGFRLGEILWGLNMGGIPVDCPLHAREMMQGLGIVGHFYAATYLTHLASRACAVSD